MSSFVITFPLRFATDIHPADDRIHPDIYVIIDADDETTARERAFEHFGTHWAFIYPIDKFEPSYHPRGCLGVLSPDGTIAPPLTS